MSQSPNLALPYLAAGQAQKHVTVNEALRLLDALVQAAVESAALSAPPGPRPKASAGSSVRRRRAPGPDRPGASPAGRMAPGPSSCRSTAGWSGTGVRSAF